MFLIVGLGNPGGEYEGTRHNVGFSVVDLFAGRHGISVNQKKHRALVGAGMACGRKVLLAKPQTYMNLSGESVSQLISWHKLDAARDLVVVCDDVNLERGLLRIRARGSAGGHNGLKNIIALLGTDQFCRFRLGVGACPRNQGMVGYVLGRFSREEGALMRDCAENACDALEMLLSEGVEAAMNRYNRKSGKGDSGEKD